MATQTDVQQLIQSLTPSNVNNGNPNTVYNTPRGAYAPPVYNASGDLLSTLQPPQQGIDWSKMLPTQQVVPSIPGGSGLGLNPNWTPMVPNLPTLPPISTGEPPPVQLSPSVLQGNPNLDTGSVAQNNTLNNLQGSGGNYAGPLPGFGSVGPIVPGSGPTMPSGSFDWKQLLDTVSEPFLSGDFYHSGTGQWDVSNILSSLGTAATGVPFNDLLTMIGKYGAQQGWSDSNPFVNHYMDNVQNALSNTLIQGQTNMGSSIQSNIDAQLQGLLNSNPNLGAFSPEQMALGQIQEWINTGNVGALYKSGASLAELQKMFGGNAVRDAGVGGYTPFGASAITNYDSDGNWTGAAQQYLQSMKDSSAGKASPSGAAALGWEI